MRFRANLAREPPRSLDRPRMGTETGAANAGSRRGRKWKGLSMLDTLSYPTQVGSATVLSVPVPVIRGVSLAHRLTRLTPTQRGIVGAKLHTGALNPVQLTIEQSAQLTHTDSTYVWEGSPFVSEPTLLGVERLNSSARDQAETRGAGTRHSHKC
jgi:hypothetical protein